jgi:small subunit ribosomal protein S1
VQAVVLNIDKDNERFSLGIKQLSSDPWDEIPRKYRPCTRVTGTVTNVTDFGLFLELEEGIEGLVHISEIAKDKRGNPMSRFQIDDVIQAKVLNVSRDDKKIGLSVRKLDESDEKEIFRSYLNNHREATSNLGDLLREEMMNLDRQGLSAADESEPAETYQSESDTKEEETDDSSPEETMNPDHQVPSLADESEPDKTYQSESDTKEEETGDSSPEEKTGENAESV